MEKFKIPCDCGVCDECIAREENLHIKNNGREKRHTKPPIDDHLVDPKEKTPKRPDTTREGDIFEL